MIGTRGTPAQYGGFETAVEEVGRRLAAAGHEVVVYCRGSDRSRTHLGMRRVLLPALRHPVMETLSHTALSVGHLLFHRTDVALVFNAANAPLLPVIRAARIPVAVHVDGLEWQRAKWGPAGRRYYLANERLAVALADELISDAAGIQEYYRIKYRTDSALLAYGAPIIDGQRPDLLEGLGLEPHGYHLVVARVEPENHVDLILDGYRSSDCTLPIVVVGSVPYESEHEQRVQEIAASDDRIRLLGSVWDQDLLNALYAGSASYVHGHCVGGTNPSLLRAMGAGANVVAWDVNFNREVLGTTGAYFGSAAEVALLLEKAESDPEAARDRGTTARNRAASHYRWDAVASGYEQLCRELLDGTRTRAGRRARRSGPFPVERAAAEDDRPVEGAGAQPAQVPLPRPEPAVGRITAAPYGEVS